MSSATQQAMASASRICAPAIENSTAPATPNSANRPICSHGSDGAERARVFVVVTRGYSSPKLKPDTTSERALGRLRHLIRLQRGQTAEIAGHAHALIARPA